MTYVAVIAVLAVLAVARMFARELRRNMSEYEGEILAVAVRRRNLES